MPEWYYQKRVDKRSLLKARGNDKHTIAKGKMVNYESTSKSNNFDCSYAYGKLGVAFFPRYTGTAPFTLLWDNSCRKSCSSRTRYCSKNSHIRAIITLITIKRTL